METKYWVYGFRLRDGSLNAFDASIHQGTRQEACELLVEMKKGRTDIDDYLQGFTSFEDASRYLNYLKGYKSR